MEFLPIFEQNYPRDECLLWAVKYEGEEFHELDRLLYLWSDPMYLRQYFKENEAKLNSDFWMPLTVREAVLKVMDEANSFDTKLIQIEDNAQENDFELLHSTFKTLLNNETSVKLPIELKAKAHLHKPLLRLYGLLLEENRILITGGGIKLTQSMQECEHLMREKRKLAQVKKFLKENDITILHEYDGE